MKAAGETNRIISIGEVVWDIFPRHQVLGGAPVNVAYHLSCLHKEVEVVTRVGSDALGEATVEKLAALGLPVEGIQRDPVLATGTVLVTVDAQNEPRFEVVTPAAWDAIDLAAASRLAEKGPFHLVFGTLAQRDERSRRTIRALWEKAIWRFYDINLRPPFTTRELVLESLAVADVVKANRAELAQIARWLGEPGTDKIKVARTLAERFRIAVLAVTEGEAGAWLVAGTEVFEHPGFPTEVADTVGAGDAFFATLIDGYIAGRTWQDCLAVANQRGSYVASRPGATPPMP